MVSGSGLRIGSLAAGFYEEFFDEEFDASRYANNIIQGTSISHCLLKVGHFFAIDSLPQLNEGIQQLELQLHDQVSIAGAWISLSSSGCGQSPRFDCPSH